MKFRIPTSRRVIPVLLLSALPLHAQVQDTVRVNYSAARCKSCAEWSQPHAPVKIFGNTYYVGTAELSAILITSPAGHILIDAALPQTVDQIAANIRTLGFRVEDVKLILNSHDHYDHAGGIAGMQQLSGARVVASASSARVLSAGESDESDPQFGIALPYPKVKVSATVRDGETLSVGSLRIAAHATPGHTPGGTSWTWTSCEGQRCLHMVYADSQTPVSADGFKFTNNRGYPTAIADFERGQRVLEELPCDILLTPHPGASSLWERLAARDRGDSTLLVDTGACARLAKTGHDQLLRRIADETKR